MLSVRQEHCLSDLDTTPVTAVRRRTRLHTVAATVATGLAPDSTQLAIGFEHSLHPGIPATSCST